MLRLILGGAIPLAAVLGSITGAHAQATLSVSPQVTVIGLDGTNRFLAVYDPDGAGPALPQYLPGPEVTWRSSDIDVFAVDETGLGFGRGSGEAVLTARYGELTAGVAVTVAGTQFSRQITTPDGRTRSYLLYVPQGFAGGPAPLVLAFHGGGGTGASQMHTSQLNVLAHVKNFLVAYPDGTDVDGGDELSWNGGACCGYAVANAVDDVGFTRLLIDDIDSDFNVASKRIFATGLSNGAIFVQRLAHELADRIAAFAPVAGGLMVGGDFTLKAPPRPISVMAFHGTTDTRYPFQGSTTPPRYTSIPKTIVYWLLRDRISLRSPKTVSYQHGIVTCSTFMSSQAEVTLCAANPPERVEAGGVLYDGGGHAWPGGVKIDTPWADVPTQDIDASAAMWEFFKRHPMP